MNKVISLDGTPIAFECTGQGAPLILVDGALCSRAFGPSGQLATALKSNFTVFTWDRRGRNQSGDTAPWTPEKEIQDIDALIREAGGTAFMYGISSGAVLALEAAARLPGVRKVALYEAPFIVDGTHPPMPADYLDRLKVMVAENRRGDALKHFMRWVGVPAFALFFMQLTPIWSKLKMVAHTLPYDIAMVKDYQRAKPLPADRWAGLGAPALVADGGKSPQWMRNGMRALAGALPEA